MNPALRKLEALAPQLALLVGAFLVSWVGAGVSAEQPAPSARTLVVISDLHLGVGRVASGDWHPHEDFRWASEFTAFLSAVGQDSSQAVDLVLNGDTFDLVQQSDDDACGRETGVGCNEAEALARLEVILRAHGAELAALSRFAQAGSNRVVFVPGDADAALLFPAVARRVVQALEVPADRAEVAASGFWRSRDGRVHVEHGHQTAFSAYRFDNWPSPFTRRSNREHLERPWGEQVTRQLFDRLEERFPVVDNIAATGMGLKYGMAANGFVDAGEAADRLLQYVLFNFSWQQFRKELDDGEVQPPQWDLQRVRSEGPAFLVSAVPEDDPYKPIAQKSLADNRLGSALDRLSDQELVMLCDYRAAVRRSRRRFEPTLTQLIPRGPIIAECPRTPETRGRIFDYFWRSRDELYLSHIATIEKRPGGPAARLSVLVHGHSHLPDRSQSGALMISGDLPKIPTEGFSPVRFALTPVVINGGAWQRTITPVQLERLKVERGLTSDADLLGALTPEQLAPCYSFVHIEPYERGTPAPIVRYWRQTDDGAWAMGPSCSR